MFNELLKKDIYNGINGKNQGIPTGFKTIDSNTNGIQKSIYTILGGSPGTGKTSFADLAYVLNPYKWYLENKHKTNLKFRIIYNSMERNTKYKLAKWACLKLFQDYNIVIDVPTMLGWQGKSRDLSSEDLDKIFECGKYFDQMFESGVIEILDGPRHPQEVYNHIHKRMLENGKIIKLNEFSSRYAPNDSDTIWIVINDHIGKLKGDSKETLDNHSSNMGYCRDFFGISVVDICQFNRSLGNIDRFKTKTVSPEPDDFKGSGDMFENADVALGLFNPYKFKINDFLGYNIPKFVTPTGENRFRSISIIKNSYGADDIIIGLNFLGENGNFRELPTSDRFNENPNYYYEKAVNFK